MLEHAESRFPCRNTKLASGLLCCGFTLKTSDPFQITKAEDGTGSPVVTFWFNPAHNNMLARDMAIAWDMSAQANVRTPAYLFWMRSALERRDWILKEVVPSREFGVYAHIPSQHVRLGGEPGDIRLVSMLSVEHKLLYYKDERFYFAKTKELAQDMAQWGMSDDELKAKGLLSKRVSWRKKALMQQDALYDLFRGALSEATALLAKNKEGDLAFIPLKADRNQRRAILSELFKMESDPHRTR